MFIETEEGALIPVARIIRIDGVKKTGTKGWKRIVHTADGERYAIGETTANDLSQTIIPAGPGFELLLFDPGTRNFEIEPVIAWAVEAIGRPEAIPITPCGGWVCDNPKALRYPNGAVQDCDEEGRQFANVGLWLEFVRSNASGKSKNRKFAEGIEGLKSFGAILLQPYFPKCADFFSWRRRLD